jgi:hypothetical protein
MACGGTIHPTEEAPDMEKIDEDEVTEKLRGYFYKCFRRGIREKVRSHESRNPTVASSND